MLFDHFNSADRALLHAIARKLDLDVEIGLAGLRMEKTMSKELDDLTNEVEAVKGTQASAVAALNRLADMVTAAGTDPAKLAALTADLKASADQLALAIDATAPAQPPIVT